MIGEGIHFDLMNKSCSEQAKSAVMASGLSDMIIITNHRHNVNNWQLVTHFIS